MYIIFGIFLLNKIIMLIYYIFLKVSNFKNTIIRYLFILF